MGTLSNNSMILIYGFNEDEVEFLKSLSNNNSLRLKVLDKSMVNVKIKDVVNGINIPIYDDTVPEEKVILFNNIEDEKVNLLIKEIRTNEEINCILAVVTPNSREWTFKELLKDLIKEREWYRKSFE